MTKRISGRVALILVCVGAILVLFLGWTMFVGPQRSKASDLSVKVSNTQSQVADAQQLSGRLLGQEEPRCSAPARGRHACPGEDV